MGAVLGSGKQHFPFVHIDDVVGAIQHVILNQQSSGIYNVVAPGTATNQTFTYRVARTLKRPVCFKISESLLKLVFLEGAMILTEGQNVIPERLVAEGFTFQYDKLDTCIEQIVRRQPA